MTALARSKTPTPKFRQWASAHGTPWEVSFPRRGPLAAKRRFFPTEEEAHKAVAEWLRGSASVNLGKRVVDEVAYVRGLLPEGVTLTEAVRFFLQHHRTVAPATLRQIADAYLLDVSRSASPKYRETIGYAVAEFLSAFGEETPVSALTKAALIGYIKAPDSYWRRYDRKRCVSCLVSKARELDALVANPLDGWKFEDAPKATPHVLTNEAAQRILEHTLAERPELVPAFALQLFAGIRTEELSRPEGEGKRPLRWDDVVMGQRINVPVEVSKTDDRRVVAFWPAALTHWLNAVQHPTTGPICPVDALEDAKSRLLSTLDGVDFRQNDFRRTYASNAYALHGAAVQDWMGHTDGRMLKRHYRDFVEPEKASAYFASKPPATPANVIAITVSA